MQKFGVCVCVRVVKPTQKKLTCLLNRKWMLGRCFNFPIEKIPFWGGHSSIFFAGGKILGSGVFFPFFPGVPRTLALSDYALCRGAQTTSAWGFESGKYFWIHILISDSYGMIYTENKGFLWISGFWWPLPIEDGSMLLFFKKKHTTTIKKIGL